VIRLVHAAVFAAAAASVALLACGNQTWSFEGDAGVAAEGSTPGCTVDTDCTIATLHCDTSSGQCVPCVKDEQCTQQGLRVCDTALNQCVQCGVTGDCANGQTCEPTSHTCVASCADGGACPSGTNCNTQGVCVGCTGNSDCANASTGHVCNTGSGQCVQCIDDTTCSYPTRRCNLATDTCVQCLTGSDCDEHVCIPTTHTCLPDNDS
jgi:hypothetical protein